jgi:FkbM family methyltransferase
MKNIINQFLEKYIPILVFYRKSYSQEGEDLIVDRLLSSKKNGFYVEVGAHHPCRFSNTYFFYKRKWSGICIDPLPGTRKSFNRWRPKDITLEVGVSTEPSRLEYFMFNEPALNTFDANVASSRNGLKGYHLIERRQIQTFPLAELLHMHLKPNQAIDLLSVDVEGFDLDVLKSNDWISFRPKVIIVECLTTILEDINSDPIFILLKNQGYLLYGKSGCSFIFYLENL